jgi:hypothetical protein
MVPSSFRSQHSNLRLGTTLVPAILYSTAPEDSYLIYRVVSWVAPVWLQAHQEILPSMPTCPEIRYRESVSR